jgi:hypothetical protein
MGWGWGKCGGVSPEHTTDMHLAMARSRSSSGCCRAPVAHATYACGTHASSGYNWCVVPSPLAVVPSSLQAQRAHTDWPRGLSSLNNVQAMQIC